MTEPVLIAGAGIGGLATALALARVGIASHVLERRRDDGEEGAGIQIGPNGTRILSLLGVTDALSPLVGAPQEINVYQGFTGRTLARLPLGHWMAGRHGAPYWVAHRSDLQAALLERVRREPLVHLTTGFSVEEVASSALGAVVTGGGGRTQTGQALIAADGLWSAVRARWFGARPPVFAGKSAVRAMVAADAAPEVMRAAMVGVWLAPRAHVVHYPVRAGRDIAIVAIFDDDEDRRDGPTAVARGAIRRQLAGFADPLAAVLGEVPSWRKWGLFTLPPLGSWTKDGVALLGDAAHPVLPYLAQGGVLALEDAVVLADAVARFGNGVAQALRHYDSARRRRVEAVVTASAMNGRIYHLPAALAAGRDLALRGLPGAWLMARYDWLYGWRLGAPALGSSGQPSSGAQCSVRDAETQD